MNNTRTPFRAILVATTLTVSSLTAGHAAAAHQGNLDVRQTRINTQDLRLAHPVGAQAMLQRIKGAARRVCPITNHRSLQEVSEAAACRTRAMNDAVARLDAPMVTALHTGSVPPVMLASR